MSRRKGTNPEVTRISITGEVDYASADLLTAAGEDALSADGTGTLEISLAAVTFMSAAGIGALVAINNTARQHGQKVFVSDASRCVARLLELTALTEAFPLSPDMIRA